MTPLSLGFSCQTRFAINSGAASTKTMPFDWAITPRSVVLDALASDGETLRLSEASASVFTMPVEGRSGVRSDGMYYWHDFPLLENNKDLAPNWAEDIHAVNEKSARRWKRFRNLLRDPDLPKRLMFSNSQHNLPEFADGPEDFHQKFGFDEEFAHAIVDALNAFGAKNFRITFLSRSIGDYDRLVDAQTRMADILDVRFAGEMTLKVNTQFAASVCSTMLPGQSPASTELLEPIEGHYDNGSRIALHGNAALVYNHRGNLWGEAAPFPGGYLFVFNGANKIFTARLVHGTLHFSNNAVWARQRSSHRAQDAGEAVEAV